MDRLIPRKAFHMPELANLTTDTIAQVREKGHRKPTVFTVDAGGGDPELAAQGAALQAALGKGGTSRVPFGAAGSPSAYAPLPLSRLAHAKLMERLSLVRG